MNPERKKLIEDFIEDELHEDYESLPIEVLWAARCLQDKHYLIATTLSDHETKLLDDLYQYVEDSLNLRQFDIGLTLSRIKDYIYVYNTCINDKTI
jgi:hypothetical protein